MLTVWGRRSSSNVQAVMWCIGELGLAHQRLDAGFTYGVNDTPAFRAMNPNALVPVLRDDATEPLWETGAILRYLASQYGDASFWPVDAATRAQVDKWAEWSKVTLASSFTMPIFWPLVRVAAKDRNEAAVTKAVAAVTTILAIAEAQLAAHPYLTGAAFTLADIQLGHVLYRYYDLPIARADYPALRRYYDRLTERPSYREHVMVSYDELRAR